MNRLLFGDNLGWLRDQSLMAGESVDAVYLDPPFNSNANYNVLFKEEGGEKSRAQFHAFTDTWHWADAAAGFEEFLGRPEVPVRLVELLIALKRSLGTSPMMAYLAMMAPRILELHRVLKASGAIFLHCDPTAEHYLRVILDAVFGPANFRNLIVWKRTSAHSDAARFGRNTDLIIFYGKSKDAKWRNPAVPLDAEYVKRYKHVDTDGRRWTDDNLSAKGLQGGGYEYTYKGVAGYWRCPKEKMEILNREGLLHFTRAGGIRLKRYLKNGQEMPLQALWTDIPPINSQALERLGYPTQKPLALLDRIISAVTDPGDVVLDPFCGCGTAIVAAQKLKRRWIGMDVTELAISLTRKRLSDEFGPVLIYEAASELALVASNRWA